MAQSPWEIVSACSKLTPEDVQAAETLLDELVDGQWLQTGRLSPHDPSRRFYYLAPRAADALGHDSIVAKEPSRELRVESFAIARFCCCAEPFRKLFTKDEFIAKFSSIWYPGQPVRYYLEPTVANEVRLAFLKVDKGGPSRWDRVIESCRRLLSKRTTRSQANPQYHAQVDAFRNLVDAGRFQISLLTSLPEKRDAIVQSLDLIETSGEPRPPIVPYVVEGLFEVIHPKAR
jgi:hypothetical protein